MGKNKKGFTLAELLIVVAIIAVLVAISIPVFTSQLETSREATDLANVRSAYSQVMTAVMTEDKTAKYNDITMYRSGTGGGAYVARVKLKQARNGWQMNAENLNIGGVANGTANWKSAPKANGVCTLKYENGAMTINLAGEDHINSVSAQEFLTQDILTKIVGESYQHLIINSNEPYETGSGGTRKFLDYAKAHGFDLEKDYGATTWQIYVKPGSNETNPTKILQNPAIYWSTVKLGFDMIKDNVYVPVIGYRNGKYDVYYSQVVRYNTGRTDEYLSLRSGFANVTNGKDGMGGSATFQFENYEDAKAAYDKLFAVYEEKGTVEYSDLTTYGLTDK